MWWSMLNLVLAIICGRDAYHAFKADRSIVGWGNLICSAANAAALAAAWTSTNA